MILWGNETHGACLMALTVKNLSAMWEIGVQSLAWEDPLEKGMATHSNVLAWRIPWTSRRAWQATVHGVCKKSDTTEGLTLSLISMVIPVLPSRSFSDDGNILNLYCPKWQPLYTCGYWAHELWLVWLRDWILSFQFSSVAQSGPTLCNPMNRSMPGLPVHHQLPDFTQTHVHRVSDAIHPSHPLSSPSPPVPNPSQHQSLFQWVNSSHEVAKVLELQL